MCVSGERAPFVAVLIGLQQQACARFMVGIGRVERGQERARMRWTSDGYQI
jgi:hypothetical protein